MTAHYTKALLGACSLLALVGAAQAQQADTEKFFAGKNVDFLIGSAPGGGYGIYGAVLGRVRSPPQTCSTTRCRRTVRRSAPSSWAP